ncbi:MAG: PQQ-dependent sugar dehydrogenase [Nitrososphaerales archaeon]
MIPKYQTAIVLILSFFFAYITLSAMSYAVDKPAVIDRNLKLEIVYQGNVTPGLRELNQFTPVTQFAFLGNNDILVLSKNDGKVLRISNYTLSPMPLLDVNVTNQWESGLLGIATSKSAEKAYVYLYYTESARHDVTNSSVTNPSYNKLYRYELINDKLVNPRLLFTAPSANHYSHIGGGLRIGPDNNLYLTVGDMHGDQNMTTRTMAQNYIDGVFPDGRAGVLRFTQNGNPVEPGILGEKYPLNLYFAYGIRNSFGLDFDPVSGKLWDTENGPQSGDEINLVEPGSNGGWNKIQGMGVRQNLSNSSKVIFEQPMGLVDFGGKGKYSAPEFVWKKRVAPTAIKFLNSEQLGKKYQNDLFVASFNFGEIYDFNLNKNRTKLEPSNRSNNIVLLENLDLKNVMFAHGLGKITDMDVGPDGNLYVLSKYLETPTIFRISSTNKTQ